MLLNAHPFPRHPRQLFENVGPLALEIGFGDGMFLDDLAGIQPDWNIVGADTARPSVERALRRLRRHQRTNVWLYRGSGVFLLRNLCPKNGLHRAFINFPDPWPKKRHAHRRMLTSDFFTLLSTRLAPNGALLLTTDHEEYFHSALSASSDNFVSDIGPPPQAILQTRYARKWLAQQRPVFHAKLCVVRLPKARFPLQESLSSQMHHTLLKGTLRPLTEFSVSVYDDDHSKIVLLDAYQPAGRTDIVFRVRVTESDLIQDILVEARQKKDDRVLVRIMTFGQPLSTQGTRSAVRSVTRHLESFGLMALEYYC